MISSRQKRVVVVGAGMGGLVAALELACQGLAVTVLDKNAQTGGKLAQSTVQDRRLDCGPTVLTMPWIFDEIFQRAGANFRERVTLRPLAQLARHFWTDGSQLDLFSDIERSVAAIAAFSDAREAEGYRRFAQRAQEVFELLDAPFMRSSCSSPLQLMRAVGVRQLHQLTRIAPFHTLHGVLKQYFRDPRLIQLFGRYATYCGSSPYQCPATLMLVTHAERCGVWSIDGGMAQLGAALTHLCSERGVIFEGSAAVARVVTTKSQVRGVELNNGRQVPAELVVMNADAAALSEGCFGKELKRASAGVGRSQRSLSAVTWCLLARPSGRSLARHNVFFADDYKQEFDDLFGVRRVPQQATVYVCAQDRHTEVDQAPAPERLFCLVNAPADGDFKPLVPKEIFQCQERMLSLLGRCKLNLQFDQDQIAVTTPDMFHQRYPATGGALYGRASHGWTASFRRAKAKTSIAGLYLAGGSTHPGPGLPMAALSGTIAAKAILSDLALTATWPPMVMHGGIWTR